MMQKITRELIYTIARHSNWPAESVARWLREGNVYASTSDWIRFLRLLMLVLGAGFLIAGVVFFFAYNWADMHKFVKLGLLELLLVSITLFMVFSKLSEQVKNILLTTAGVVMGVLFAVFGQIYQTGANAYDFFLGWTGCIILWVLVARFQPLWFLFLLLVNTTFILYKQQEATQMPFTVMLDVLFVLNGTAVVAWEILYNRNIIRNAGRWLPRILSLAAIVPLTMSMIVNIFDVVESDNGICFILAVLAYSAGIWYGLRKRDLFYLSVIPFSAIVVVAVLIVQLAGNDPAGVFLLACLFVMGSVAMLIRSLIQFNRKWHV